jgi:hypothetical protein
MATSAPAGTSGGVGYVDPFAANTPPVTAQSPIADQNAMVNGNQAQAAKMGISIPGVSTPPPDQPAKPVTAFSSDTATQYATDNTQKLQTLKDKGLSLGADGLARYSDSSFATAPSDAVQTENGTWQSGGVNYAIGPSTTADPELTAMNDKINAMKAEFDANSKAGIDLIQKQYNDIIQQQTQENTRAAGAEGQTLLMSGTSRYAPMDANGILNTFVSNGIQKLADLNTKETAAINAAQTAQDNGDMKLMDSQLTLAQKARDDKQAAAKALSDKLTAQNDTLVAKQKQNAIDTAVGTQLSNGVTDPAAIVKALGDAGITATAKDVADSIANLNPNAKEVATVMGDAAKGGAPQDVLAAIGKSTNLADAYKAAAPYLTDPTTTASQYNAYVAQAKAAGQTPLSAGAFLAKQSASDAYSKAYATAAGAAAGAASLTPTTDVVTPIGLGGDSNGGSLLAQTGLSIGAYNYLTQGTASMSRMPAAQRTAIMNEAQNWLNKNRIDISTFPSQYKAYNEVVQNNIARANNTTIAANEISGTVDQFLKDITPTDFPHKNILGGGLTSASGGLPTLRPAVILDLMAGKQVNNPTAQKYAFDIQTMANDLAGYFAASRSVGASGTVPTPDDADKAAAAAVISDGLNGGSAQAFKDSINSNEKKVTGVVNSAVTNAQKQVWSLFGVGDKYAAPVSAEDANTQQIMQDETVAEGKIGTFYNASDSNKKLIDDIHAQFPDLSAQEVVQKLGL